MELPYVDELRVTVAAPPDAVWRALAAPGAGLRPARAFAAVVGARPREVSGDPLLVGSTVPGFEVTEAEPGRTLVLAGRHHFSACTLTYVLAETAVRNGTRPGTVLRAQTHAVFPGLAGRLYRIAVIGTGAHRVLTSRLLRAIRRRAEAV